MSKVVAIILILGFMALVGYLIYGLVTDIKFKIKKKKEEKEKQLGTEKDSNGLTDELKTEENNNKEN